MEPALQSVSPAVFQSVFDQSPIAECLVSATDDPTILAANEAFLRACGRAREGLVGQRLFAVFPGNPQDPGDTGVAALRDSLAQVLATGRAHALPLQRYPIRVAQTDGSQAFEERFWRAVNVPILAAQGAVLCIAHRTEDVTAQTRTAQALAHSSERLAFQLALSDRLRTCLTPDETAAAASAMLGEKMGLTRVTYVEVDDVGGTFVQKQWVGKAAVAPAPSPARRHLKEFGSEIIATLRRGEPLIIQDVRSDVRTRAHADAYASIDVRSNLAIPLLKAGRLLIVLSLQHNQRRAWTSTEVELAIDVAERTWSAAENARAQEELRAANRRKDDFLAMLAHELRNPLAPIRFAAELLARGPLDGERMKKTTDIVARQVRHMSGLVDDLLDVSRVTRGIVTLDESPQDMKSIVASAIEQVRPQMESLKHHLVVDLSPDAATVCGDGKRLVQVMTNLLNNAAKFTPSGGRIQVSMAVDLERVRVQVRDNGIGIPADVQAHVFDLFAQAERSADRSQGGLGLGLALVKSLVERHHGTVTLHSDGEGTGSCFTISLPRLKRPSAPVPAASPASQRARGPAVDILIVDDNVDAAEMLRALLEDAGHRVRARYDPHGALEAARHTPPQVALIDIGLPSLNGYELVRRLRAHPATATGRYVALTGYGQPADREQALAAGFDEHLVKPADPDVLLRLLDRWYR